MPPIIRSVLSIVGAFFVVAVLVGLATALAAQLMLGSTRPDTEPTTPFLVVNLTYSVLFAIVGGYVAATVSDHSPLGHAAALSAFMMLLGLLSWLLNGGQPASAQPDWYPWVMYPARAAHRRSGGNPGYPAHTLADLFQQTGTRIRRDSGTAAAMTE
jgi:hypothetical protein